MKRLLLTTALLMTAVVPSFAEDRPEIPPLPVAVSSFGAAACDGHLYVYGGHTGTTHHYSTDDVTDTFRRLKLDGEGGWEDLPGGPPSQGLALAAHGGTLYRVGGMQPRNAAGTPSDNHSLKTCARFDPATREWEALPDLPAGRSSHDAAFVGDKLYVVGGWEMKGRDVPSVWHDKAAVLDVSRTPMEWELIDQPFRRRALGAAAFGGKLYVFGGISDTGLEPAVEVFDPAAKEWSRGPAIPGIRRNAFSPAACVSDGRLFLCPADGTLYRLNGPADGWEAVGDLRKNRLVHRMVPIGSGNLAVLGGGSPGGNVAATEILRPETDGAARP